MISLNRILNVSNSEWPRIIASWSLMFLARYGFIVGWSVLLASFLSHVGIDKLPLLFLANAITVMIGTVFYRQIIHKLKRELLITITALCGSALLLLSIIFLQTNMSVFFAILVIVESVFVAQLWILISLFNEEMFTPLESQRTFPIIESAETLGGIFGGLTLSLLAESMAPYKFLIIWALALLMILPIVLKFNTQTLPIPKLSKTEKTTKTRSIHETFKQLKKIPFLKALMLIVLLHWSIMNVVEFQYTKAIQQEVYGVHEETIVEDGTHGGVVLASEGHSDQQEAEFEKAIAKKLGSLHVLFNAAALLIQLLVASRIITRLGVISSLLIHPIVTLLNMVGLTLRFGFNSAVLTRGSYELTGIIFKNAYDSSYYAIAHDKRDEVKELMQGIIKPLGALVGTASILFVTTFSHGFEQTFLLNSILIVMGLVMSLVVAQMHNKYTSISESNLSKRHALPTRLNAVEILGQNGHLKLTSSLYKLLKRKGEPTILKERILNTLGQRKELESIGVIIEMLSAKDDMVRLSAINALRSFADIKRKIRRNSFTLHRIIEGLKDALHVEKNDFIREQFLRCFHNFAPEQLSAYIIDSIKKNDKNAPALIRMLRVFPDPNLKYYLEPHLGSPSMKIRAASIIALWQFPDMKRELIHILENMLNSNSKSQQILAIETCGQIHFKKGVHLIKKHVFSDDEDLRDASILALAKMGERNMMQHVLNHICNPAHEWFENVDLIFRQLKPEYANQLKKQFHNYIHLSIHRIMNVYNELEHIEEETLKHLECLYEKIHAHHEAHKIKKLLDSLR